MSIFLFAKDIIRYRITTRIIHTIK